MNLIISDVGFLSEILMINGNRHSFLYLSVMTFRAIKTHKIRCAECLVLMLEISA